MLRRFAWLLVSAPLALLALPALAQDAGTTVVRKTPSVTGALPTQQPSTEQREPLQTSPEAATQPKDQLRPAQDVDEAPPPAVQEPSGAEPSGAAPASGTAAVAPAEINPNPTDEGASWDSAIEAAPAPTPLIGDEQTQAVQRINAYFNGITSLQGNFEQVDSRGKRATGRFYVQRPGKLRFDYAPPSPLRIVADGNSLAIEDSDLKTVEKYPLDSTPFRLLLGDAVDLGKDARVVGVERDEGSLAITLEDKSGEAAGQIKLVFDTSSELKLKEWVIIDAQGLATTVSLDDVEPGRKVAADFFQSTQAFQPFR